MTLKQIFIINSDLKMNENKIVVQVAHGETLYMSEICACKCVEMVHELENKEKQMIKDFDEWTNNKLMKKVILKATEEEMLVLIDIIKMMNKVEKWKTWFNIVFDKELTQLPKDSMTCIVMEPLDEEFTNHRFGHLKLL